MYISTREVHVYIYIYIYTHTYVLICAHACGHACTGADLRCVNASGTPERNKQNRMMLILLLTGGY